MMEFQWLLRWVTTCNEHVHLLPQPALTRQGPGDGEKRPAGWVFPNSESVCFVLFSFNDWNHKGGKVKKGDKLGIQD